MLVKGGQASDSTFCQSAPSLQRHRIHFGTDDENSAPGFYEESRLGRLEQASGLPATPHALFKPLPPRPEADITAGGAAVPGNG